MKIPEKILIGGIPFEIVTENTYLDEKGLFGETDYKNQRFLTKDNYSPEFQVLNLWHEFLHGMVWAHGIELGDREEKIVEIFAHALFRFSQDNKLRWTEITESR
jgi:hypothetical protein